MSNQFEALLIQRLRLSVNLKSLVEKSIFLPYSADLLSSKRTVDLLVIGWLVNGYQEG